MNGDEFASIVQAERDRRLFNLRSAVRRYRHDPRELQEMALLDCARVMASVMSVPIPLGEATAADRLKVMMTTEPLFHAQVQALYSLVMEWVEVAMERGVK